MENISKGIENYLEKINCLVACLKCDIWIAGADEESISAIFNTAVDIERTLSREEAEKLNETLLVVYPEYDFILCGDLVLEILLIRAESNEAVILSTVNKYLEIYGKKRLCSALIRLLKAKKLKVESLHMISRLKSECIVKALEAKSMVYLWEEMIANNNENFESHVADIFEKETSLFLECVRVSSKSTAHIILTVILRHLNCETDLSMWFTLLNNRNIKVTSVLCSQFPEFMDGLLKFFSNYATQAELQEGESFSWAHNIYPLNKFIDILHFLLTNDGLVGIKVNEFINREINNFDENYSFWLDVKTLLH